MALDKLPYMTEEELWQYAQELAQKKGAPPPGMAEEFGKLGIQQRAQMLQATGALPGSLTQGPQSMPQNPVLTPQMQQMQQGVPAQTIPQINPATGAAVAQPGFDWATALQAAGGLMQQEASQMVAGPSGSIAPRPIVPQVSQRMQGPVDIGTLLARGR